MKIFYLADTSSIHTKKWVNYFLNKGYDITCISFSNEKIEGTKHISIFENNTNISKKGLINKLAYLKKLKFIKEYIKKEKPDILHAHYASSYGLLGSLCNYKPFIISAWGSDVFEFPKINFITKKILEFNLKSANIICSTSNIMAKEISKYTSKDIVITPFGVDTDKFKPNKSYMEKDNFVIGTVKTLNHTYGIDILIKAFYLLAQKYTNISLKIIGDGDKKQDYIDLVSSLNIVDKVEFISKIDNSEVPKYLNEFTIFSALSREESFGVSVIEAMSCGIPVVVSNIGGLAEVVLNEKTGFCVKSESPESAFDAFEKLINNKELIEEFSINSREHILKNYSWLKNAEIMNNLYKSILKF